MKANTYMLDHYGKLSGKTVTAVVHDDGSDFGEILYGLKFNDGTILWFLRDAEGNGGGYGAIDACE